MYLAWHLQVQRCADDDRGNASVGLATSFELSSLGICVPTVAAVDPDGSGGGGSSNSSTSPASPAVVTNGTTASDSGHASSVVTTSATPPPRKPPLVKLGRGALLANPGNRFKHKTIRYEGQPFALATVRARAAAASSSASARPLVFAMVRSSDGAGKETAGEAVDVGAYALSVRSSSADRFQINVCRLDAVGWDAPLQLDYLSVNVPSAAVNASSSGCSGSQRGGPCAGGVWEVVLAGGGRLRYGSLALGARSGPTTLSYNFTEPLIIVQRWSGVGGGMESREAAPTLLLSTQATTSQHRDEAFLVRARMRWGGAAAQEVSGGQGPVLLRGFDATVSRADVTGKADWAQPLQLNWLLAIPAASL